MPHGKYFTFQGFCIRFLFFIGFKATKIVFSLLTRHKKKKTHFSVKFHNNFIFILFHIGFVIRDKC